MIAVAVIVAAGKGERFGDASKVLATVLDRPVLAWTLDAFEAAHTVNEVVIVVGRHTAAPITELLALGPWTKVVSTVIGGDTRQQSMARGVATVRADADVVLVHDAARPLVDFALINTCATAADAHGGAILATPVTDTIKRVEGEHIVQTIDRATLWQAQTPQAFRREQMNAMAALALEGTTPMTDEASLAEALGYPVRIVRSDVTNLKITQPHDLVIAETILRQRKAATP